MNDSSPSPEELDLAILGMDTPAAEKAVLEALEGLSGVVSVRLIERGAFLRYKAETVTKDEICDAVRKAGYRATVFQDSKTGETGSAPA